MLGSDLVESRNVHRLNKVLEGCDLFLQDVCAHLTDNTKKGQTGLVGNIYFSSEFDGKVAPEGFKIVSNLP